MTHGRRCGRAQRGAGSAARGVTPVPVPPSGQPVPRRRALPDRDPELRGAGGAARRRRRGGGARHHGQPGLPGQRRDAALRGRAGRDGRASAPTTASRSRCSSARGRSGTSARVAAVRRGAVPGRRAARHAPAAVRRRRHAARRSSTGIRGFLVADTGLLELLSRDAAGRASSPRGSCGRCRPCSRPSNPLTVRLLEQLGASTINVPSDLTLGQLAEMRAASHAADRPVRGGARTAWAAWSAARRRPTWSRWPRRCTSSSGCATPGRCTPAGCTWSDEASLIAREKVRRAAVALEWMARSGLGLVQSGPAAAGPRRPGADSHEQRPAQQRLAGRRRRGRAGPPGRAALLGADGGPTAGGR